MNGNGIECAFLATIRQDPEARLTRDGKPWLRAGAAVKQGEETQWISLMIFGDQVGELQGQLAKGLRIYAEGRLDASAYIKDGEACPSLTCFPWLVQPVGRIGRRRGKNGKPAEEQQPADINHVTNDWQAPAASESELDDEIPF